MIPLFKRALWAYVYPNNDALAQLVEDAKDLFCDCIIAKCGNGATFFDYANRTHVEWKRVVYAVKANGLTLGAEAYQYGYKPEAEGGVLARACAEGADFAVCNAEVEFEGQSADVSKRLVRAYRAYCGKPLTICVDSRGSRYYAAYQRGFRETGIDGYMPMVYPLAYYPGRPHGFIQRSFDETIVHPMRDYPLSTYPAIQAYDNMDYHEVVGQLVCAKAWKAPGVGIYVAHDIKGRAWFGLRDTPVYGLDAITEPTYTKAEILNKVEAAF